MQDPRVSTSESAGERRVSPIRRAAWLVLASALLLKIALLVALERRHPEAFQWIDSETYLAPARALARFGTYAAGPDRLATPEVVRTPGYPLIAAALFRAFGEKVILLSLFGLVVSTWTVVVVLTRFRFALGDHASALAAILLALDPGSFCRSLEVLSETTFAFLVVVGLSFLAKSDLQKGLSMAAAGGAGICFSLATLVRPILAWFLPIAVLLFFWAERPRRRGWLVTASFALVALAPTFGWMVRNERLGGRLALTPVVGHQLLHRRAAAVLALREGRPLAVVQDELGIREAFFRFRGPSAERELFGAGGYRATHPRTRDLSVWELDRLWAAQAMDIFRRHPLATAWVVARSAMLVVAVPPSLLLSDRYGLVNPSAALAGAWENQDWLAVLRLGFREEPALAFVSCFLFLALVLQALLACRGAVLLARRRTLFGTLCVVACGYLVLASASTDASDDRYRVPVAPLLATLCAVGVSSTFPPFSASGPLVEPGAPAPRARRRPCLRG